MIIQIDSDKLSPNKDHAVVKSEIDVDGVIWNVTCTYYTIYAGFI